MIHLRIDNHELNIHRKFACGIGPELPEGDMYFFAAERVHHHKVDCPKCAEFADPIGTPISQLSGQPGSPGFARFCEIGKSWGYD